MKKFLVLGFFLAVGVVVASSSWEPVEVKLNSLTNTHLNLTDSTDTLEIDTFYSDTISLTGVEKLAIGLVLDTVKLGTGSNDSSLWIIQLFARSDGVTIQKLIRVDTLGGNNVRRDTLWYYIDRDTVPHQSLYWRSIFKDSAIVTTNSGAGGAKLDTTYMRGYILVNKSGCE